MAIVGTHNYLLIVQIFTSNLTCVDDEKNECYAIIIRCQSPAFQILQEAGTSSSLPYPCNWEGRVD